MATCGHFAQVKITFYCISHHFRSIWNFNFSTKWVLAFYCISRNIRSTWKLKKTLFIFKNQFSQNRYWHSPGRSMDSSNMTFMGAFYTELWRSRTIFTIFSQNGCHLPICFSNFVIIDSVPLWIINGRVKYKFDMDFGVTVSQALAAGPTT